MVWFGKARRRARIARDRRVPDERWARLVARVPLLEGLSETELERLRDLAVVFAHEKRFEGCGGFVVDDDVRMLIAIQACLLVLELGLDAYRGFSDVLVYPSEFRTRWTSEDEHGIVTEEDGPMLGEAWPGGPVVLSWEDVASGGVSDATSEPVADGFNLVVHEFAHKLDMLTGAEDGLPPLPGGMDAGRWCEVFERARASLAAEDARGVETSIDSYACESPAECFAVFSEAFFDAPLVVAQDYPEVYEQLRGFYRQDPAGRVRLD